MLLPAPFRELFHLGYVVTDLERAMAGMRDRFGVDRWTILPLGDEAPAKAIGFAYVQETMLELVEVNLAHELMPIHRGWLPASADAARLNHVAYLLADEAELLAQKAKLEAAGVATAWIDSFGDIFSRYYYADTTAELGHFTEFLCLGPAGADFLAQIPRN